MEKLTYSLHSLQKALKTLNAALELINSVKPLNQQELILACQDSVIQRFEYSCDGFWKFLKLYFETIHEIKTDEVKSPKNVFRMCVKEKICSEIDGETLIKMANARNATSHKYSIDEVYAILPHIPTYYHCMVNIIQKIELSL